MGHGLEFLLSEGAWMETLGEPSPPMLKALSFSSIIFPVATMQRILFVSLLLLAAPCIVSGMCRNSSAFLATHETIVNCAGLTQAQCEAAHNNPCNTEWKPDTLICEFKPTAGAAGLQRQSCTDASGTVDDVVTCGAYPAFYFTDVEFASDCLTPNVRLPHVTNGQLMHAFAQSPWGCCSDGVSMCSDPASLPGHESAPVSKASIFQDMDGNLHINSSPNQSVYINGQNVLERLNLVQAKLQAITSVPSCTFESIYTLTGHKSSIVSLASFGDRLYSGSDDWTIRVWDLTASPPTSMHILTGHTSIVTALVIGGGFLYSGAEFTDNRILVWNITSPTPFSVYNLTGHTSSVRALAIADGRLFSGSYDKTIKIWNLSTFPPAPIHTLTGHDGGVVALAIKGNLLYSGSTDNTVRVWNLAASPPSFIHSLVGHTSPVFALASADDRLYSGSRHFNIRVWNLTAPDPSSSIFSLTAGHPDAVRALATSNDYLFAGYGNTNIGVWDLRTLPPSLTQTLTGHSDPVWALATSGDRLYSGSGDGTIRVWASECEQ